MPSYIPKDVKLSLKADAPDDRDHLLQTTKAILPPSVTLQKYASIIEDQRGLSSCTGNALTNAYELRLRVKKKSDVELSRLFVYYNERVLENNVDQDEGATLRSGIKTLRTHGVCTEATWPYHDDLWDDKPSLQAYAEAKQRTLANYERVTNLGAMRECLYRQQAFVFGIPIYNDTVASPRNDWTFDQRGAQLLGYHAMCCVGYDDDKQRFLVKNSWGRDWGYAGYCFVSYDFMQKEALDCWTFDTLEQFHTAPSKAEPWWKRYLRFFAGTK